MAMDPSHRSHAPVKMRVEKEIDGKKETRSLMLRRVILVRQYPRTWARDRTNPDEMFELEINKVVDKKVLGEIVDRCYRKYEPPAPVSY